MWVDTHILKVSFHQRNDEKRLPLERHYGISKRGKSDSLSLWLMCPSILGSPQTCFEWTISHVVFTLFNCLCESLCKQVISKSSSKSWVFIRNLQVVESRLLPGSIDASFTLRTLRRANSHTFGSTVCTTFCSPIAKLQFLWVERNRVSDTNHVIIQ